ncbi:Uncharacterised protein [uncultured archaeon]|nr:Uncharacterised protein [uncultured archaeon]
MKTAQKGQASAEYLVLLAMALVLMLILVAMLGGFDGSISGINESESSMYWEGLARPFAVTAWGQKDDILYLSVANMGPERLFLRKIYIDNVVADLEPGWSWRAGASKTVSIPGLRMCKQNGYDSYAYNVSFVFDSILISDQLQKGEKPMVGFCN